MATQQHPAFDPNQPIAAAELPRIGGLRKDYVGAVNATEIGDDELRSAAETEARSWSELDADGKIIGIEAKWKTVKAAVEAKLIEIRDAMSIGMKTIGDAEIFFASAAALRSSLQQTKAMLKKVADLPQVKAGDSASGKLPRAYVAVESYLKRQPLSIPAPSFPVSDSEARETPARVSTYEQRRQERLSQAVFERKQMIVEKVREMHQQGVSGHDIAAELGLARGTVRKYIQTEGPVRIAPRKRKPSLLDPYYEYLCQRWNEETPTALQLLEELQEKGFQGGISIVKDFVTRLRRGLPGLKQPPQSIKMRKAPSTLSARELRWLLAKREDDLTSEEKQSLEKLFELSQEVSHIYCFLQSFLRMVRELKPDLLNGWMKEVRESQINELVSFVNGIDRDYDAVRAGLTYSWSQGPVEGAVNKIKTHKRLMYGRASFFLLRKKMLHQKVS